MAECIFIYIEDTNSCGEAPNEALMKVLKGDTGNGIASIIQTSISEDELEKTYTITYTDGNEFEYIVKDGNSILSIEYIGISADGLQKTYQVNYQDGTTFQYVVNQGVGIKTITKTSTTLLTDTYTITFANNSTTTFNVKNGNGIESIIKTNTNGLVDTYTITFTDTTTTTFDVTNAKSITNIEFVSRNLLTDIYKINFNDNTNIIFEVTNGRGITNVSYISTNGLVDTYRITYNDNTTSDFIVTNGQGYTEKGLWDGITTYNPYDVVKHLNSVYVCLVENTNSTPSLINPNWVVWIDSSIMVNKTSIKQALGTSTTDIMSQKATTNAINSLNVTASIPLGSGYYTLATAIAAVPTALRKVGFEVTFESSAGVWETYQFKGVIANWSVLGSWELVPNKKYVDDLIQEVKIIDTKQDKQIKEIEDLLSTSNLNQNTTNTSTGYEKIALPKTASNGGMDIKLEGLTATNLAINGDFRNNLTNWYVTTGSEIVSVLNRELSFRSGNQYGAMGNRNPIIQGNKYYMTALLKSDSNMALISSYNGVIDINTFHSGSNQYERLSHIYTAATDINDYLVDFTCTIKDSRAVRTTDIYAKEVRFVNLTQVFGAGNEPDLATCDKIFADYFDGVKTFIPTGRIRSAEQNFYLNAPNLRSNGLVKDEIRKGANGYELVKRISEIDNTILVTPIITPIAYSGILNSHESGTIYHEPVVADASVYDTNIEILMVDYPISTIETIIKHENGIDTYLDINDAVIALDGLSFTHPDLVSGDLVLFTYFFDLEKVNGLITATYFDSRFVIADSVNSKFYKWSVVSANGVPSINLIEV